MSTNIMTTQSSVAPDSGTIKPLHNVKRNLSVILQHDFDFQSHYSYAALLSSSPNPCLYIDKVGSIVLPLSEKDATSIRRVYPYSRNDSGPLRAWEIDPKNIKFRDHTWDRFVAKLVLDDLWKVLASDSPTCPKYVLNRLSVVEAGPSALRFDRPGVTNNGFASFAVILPSSYTGGGISVQYDNSLHVYNPSRSSGHDTTLVAWMHGVKRKSERITSGRRLALHYDLVHTSSSPKPALPIVNGGVRLLRKLFLNWRDLELTGNSAAPRLLVYTLKHGYPRKPISILYLKAEDVHKASHLRPISEEFGFILLLGFLECANSGMADDNDSVERGSRQTYKSQAQSITVNHLTTLDGDSVGTLSGLRVNKDEVIRDRSLRARLSPDYSSTVLILLHQSRLQGQSEERRSFMDCSH